IVSRVIHASADCEYATTMILDDVAITAGENALRAGSPVLCDTEMVRHGITVPSCICCLDEVGPLVRDGITRSASAIRIAAKRHPVGAVVAVGCAPTALVEILRLASEESFRPALVIGMPVGFVGAAESKRYLRESSLASVSNAGEKGGSAVTAAAVNALWHLAQVS
ncbi:MAG: precorrin-8X methylmutase, partial [Mycobacterium sp.]